MLTHISRNVFAMAYAERQVLYRQIETDRNSKVMTLVTSDRLGEYWPGKGVGTIIADDAIAPFVDLLDQIGPTSKVSLILHTPGGAGLIAWRLVNLIRSFADDFEVLIPLRAVSAGTMIALGANRIVMTKQAVLGPIDPSVNHPLNPQIPNTNTRVPVSVENILTYLKAAEREAGSAHRARVADILIAMMPHLHPLVLGEALRARSQIRFLARKLLKIQFPSAQGNWLTNVTDYAQRQKVKEIIDFLCADSGSHDYTINRREALAMGLAVEKPSAILYPLLRDVHADYADELLLNEPYSAQVLLRNENTCDLSEHRGLIESADGSTYAFVTEGTITRGQPGQWTTNLSKEGWTKMP